MGLKQFTEAQNDLEKGFQLDPNNPKILTVLTECKMEINPPVSEFTVPPEDLVVTNEQKELAKKAKEQGNDAYKKKDFERAIEFYKKAIESDPTDITFYSNISAVYFEQKQYHKCIVECERGIEIGRQARADFKLISKAFARIGNSYKKLEKWHKAKLAYEKAMSEHRTPEVNSLLSEVIKIIKESERKNFIDPVRAEQEKEKGNELFKNGDYITAVKHYTEAINRNPSDPKLYSNRAACYTKLAAFDLGLKDCEKCIELDDKFIKGWLRKGKILEGMSQKRRAFFAYQKALEIDPNNAEALQNYRSCAVEGGGFNTSEKATSKAMNDPEIQAIIKDPAMHVILQQMNNDPKALME